MTWIGLALFLVIVLTGAWVWGKYSDPKSGAVGCCGCGQCLASGECVMRRRLKAEIEKNDSLNKDNT